MTVELKISANDTVKDDNLLTNEMTENDITKMVKTYEDDGVLDLLHIACSHSSLKICLNQLENVVIPSFNSNVCEFIEIRQNPLFRIVYTQENNSICKLKELFENPENQKSYESLVLLSSRCKLLTSKVTQDILEIININFNSTKNELDNISSLNEARQELMNLCQDFIEKLNYICNYIDVIQVQKNKILNHVPFPNDSPKVYVSEFSTSDVVIPSNMLSLDHDKIKNVRTLGLCVSAPPVAFKKLKTSSDVNDLGDSNDDDDNSPMPNDRLNSHSKLSSNSKAPKVPIVWDKNLAKYSLDDNEDNNIDTIPDQLKSARRRNRLNQIDWEKKLLTKINLYKDHTSQSGCITTLYEQPVNHYTLLSLLSRSEKTLENPNPQPEHVKIAIETFLAGVDAAYNYLQRLRVNKSQMRLLYESVTHLDTLLSHEELLPLLKSLQGLLKTFGMF